MFSHPPPVSLLASCEPAVEGVGLWEGEVGGIVMHCGLGSCVPNVIRLLDYYYSADGPIEEAR